MFKLDFKGFIGDDGQEYNYNTFIDTLREMSQDSEAAPAEIYFNLIKEETEEVFGSPKMKIDFGKSLYIQELCTGNAQDGFGEWQELGKPNYLK